MHRSPIRLRLFRPDLWLAGAALFVTAGIGLSASGSATSLPSMQYHLTARPWLALDTPRDVYLDRIEGIVRYEAALQNASGTIIDPVENHETYYATPYFANSLGLLMSAGRAQDLLTKGVAAMNSSSWQMAQGNSAIPSGTGNFFIAPMADALSLYAPFVTSAQITTWKNRMMLPIASLIIAENAGNWRTYAMKGQWYRFQQGLVSGNDALTFIEDSWIQKQRARFTSNAWNLYHDWSSDPDTWAYDAAARANLWNMLVHGYNGASASDMSTLIQSGTRSDLLFQDATGQAPVGGRSGLHTWNDIYTGLGFEMMAERMNIEGDLRMAGQYRHAAMLALKSAERWRSSQGYYYVTKNHFDPSLRVRYARYSTLTTYNGNTMYHMSESWRARQSAIIEQPAPVEIGGYALVPDSRFAIAAANAGGMQLEASMRGTTILDNGQYWNALGIDRFSRVGWESRLGPSDGVRDLSSGLGVSYAPEFLESGSWVRLADVPSRYAGTFSVTFAHPLLVRCRIDYAPKAGQNGPTFTDDLIITPDGVLSTITSSAGTSNFGVTWPVLNNDGAPLTNTYTSYIATTNFPAGGDSQNFIALSASSKLVTNLPTLRSSYGDICPVRMVSGASNVQTFIYPRNPWDPSAESVRTSFTRNGGDFSTLLGRVKGNFYIGRTSAGGVGTAIDLDNDGANDVTFDVSCGFILRLANGIVTAIEADRAVTAVVQGRTVSLSAFTPVTLVAQSTLEFEAESGTPGGGAQVQSCANCSAGRLVGYLGNGGAYNGTLTFSNVNVPVAGKYLVTLYYSSQYAKAREAIFTINGVAGAPVAFPSTGSWTNMVPRSVTVNLQAGVNSIVISNDKAKAPAFDRVRIALSTEAEAGTLGGGAQVSDCPNCSGGKSVGFLGNGGTYNGTLTLSNVNVPAAGRYVITLYYSNQDVGDRTGTLTVNGVTGAPISFASTGKWTTMAPYNVTVTLNAGNNTIAIGNSAAKAPTFDRVELNIP